MLRNFKLLGESFKIFQKEWKQLYNVFFEVFKMMNICDEYHQEEGMRQDG